MSGLLLDTCSLIFYTNGLPSLSKAAMERIGSSEGVAVSVASIAEIACAHERGRLEIKTHWHEWWKDLMQRTGWNCIPVTAQILEEAFLLKDLAHKDPIDRIMIATARIHGLLLITTDRRILQYPHVQTLS
jgi:PIN domain nuclease of toxin-antitoxin system